MLFLVKGLEMFSRAIINLGAQSVALVLDISHDLCSATQFTKGQARLGLIFPFLLLNSHEFDCSTHVAPEHFDLLTLTISLVSYITAQVLCGETDRACPYPNL